METWNDQVGKSFSFCWLNGLNKWNSQSP
jgi:hypothetical protein